MNWFNFFGWCIFAIIILATMGTVLSIDRKNSSTTPELALVSIAVHIGFLVWIYIAIMR